MLGGTYLGDAFFGGSVAVTAVTQSATPTGIGSTAAFGAPSSTLTFHPTGIGSTVAFGVPTNKLTFHVTGIASTVAFGTLTNKFTAHPTGIASATAVAFPSATTVIGTYFLTLTGLPSTVALGAPSFAPTGHVLPTGIAPTVTVASASAVTVRDVKTCSPTGLSSTVAFGAPALGSGSQAELLPTGIASVAVVASASATTVVVPVVLDRRLRLRAPGHRAPGGAGFRRYVQQSAHNSQTISVAGIPPNGTYTTQGGAAYTNQAEDQAYTIQAFPTIGHPTVTRVRTVVATGIPSTNAFGVPNVRGPARLTPAGIPTTVAFGDPTFTRFQTAILPIGIPTTVRFGTIGANITTGITGIPTTVAFGTPKVGPTAHWNVKEPRPRWTAGFPHGRWHAWDPTEEDPHAHYTHIARPIGPARHRLTPAGITSTVAFGTIVFPAADQTVITAGIAPTNVFGEPALNRGSTVTITLPGISSTAAFGEVELGTAAHTGPLGVSSTLRFGIPSVARPPRRTLTVTGIASTLHLGPGTLAKRPNKKTLSPTGRSSTVAFGAPTVFRKSTGPPPPPPDVIVPFSVADPNGVIDVADAVSAWAATHVVSGTQANPQRVLFQRLKNNGQRATYRVDRAMHLANGKHDIVFDGGGSDIVIADDGSLVSGGDGANFIQTVDAPFLATADPNTNPRGAFRHNGAALDAPVPPYGNFVTYAVGDVIHSGGNQYQSKLAGNLNHLPPNATWWTNLGPDGQLTSRDGPTGPAIDFIALGVIPGDQVRILNPANLHVERDVVVNVVHNSTTITLPAGSPDSFSNNDRGALMTSTKLGFPSGEIIGYFVDATHMTLSEFYTGVTGTATVHIGNTNHTDRNVIAVTGQHTLTYAGGSLGQGTSDITVNPNDGWANIYTPTNVVESTWNSYDQASNRAFDQNRSRSMLNFTKATRVKVHGFRLTGMFDSYDGSVSTFFDWEAQDGIQWDACNNVEESHCVIEKFWGNGFEQRQFIENDNSLTPTRGVWVHDCWHSTFNRQAASLTFGYAAILERVYLGESQRSLIDCEPTTTRVGTGTNPVLTYAMQDVHLIDCIIGDHALGMLSMHEGLGRVHLVRPRAKTTYAAAGGAIGSSGVAVVDWLIVEDAVSDEAGQASSSYAWQFDTGARQGGHNIMIINSQDMHSRIAGVNFNHSNGPCTNYLITGNDFGAVPQSTDGSGGNGTPVTLFSVPIPPHALRDKALAGP